MRKALFIVGPTAVGKTRLAFKISNVIPSVLISADSIQVYRGADIISGKDNSIRTYLLDVLPITSSFSVREFVEKTRSLVERAKEERKIPIIVGGTGFYIDALFGKIDTINIPPQKSLREKLEKLEVRELKAKLKKLSPEKFNKMNTSDINNKRRLIRAIEISQVQGPTLGTKPLFRNSEALIIGLRVSLDNLKKRIATRVKKRVEMGALEEARGLFEKYEKLSSQIKTAAGYKQLFGFLAGRITFEEAVRRWIIVEGQLAKNQMTWFRKNKTIRWFDIGQKGFEAKIMRLIKHELGL